MKITFARLILISGAAMGTLLCAQTADQSAPAPVPQATTPAHHTATPQQTLDRLTKKLTLTADQQSQLLPILTDRQQQVVGINNDTTLTQKQRHAKLLAVRNDAESRIRAVLTDAQRTAYDEMQQEARDRAKSRKSTAAPNQ